MVKIYLAGNFPQMGTIEEELTVMSRAAKKSEYCRLVSFYYTPECVNVFKAAFRHTIITRYASKEEGRGIYENLSCNPITTR